eukprot:1083790-Rhodomonas_salina.1
MPEGNASQGRVAGASDQKPFSTTLARERERAADSTRQTSTRKQRHKDLSTHTQTRVSDLRDKVVCGREDAVMLFLQGLQRSGRGLILGRRLARLARRRGR